jgi:hypothetical protein
MAQRKENKMMIRFLKTKFKPFKIGWITVISSKDENENVNVYLKTEEISLFEYVIAGRFVSHALHEWIEKTPPAELVEYIFGKKRHPNHEIADEWIFWKFTFSELLSLEKTEKWDNTLERCYGASVRPFQALPPQKLPNGHKRLGRYFFFTTMDKNENVIVVPYGRKWFEECDIARGNFEDVATRMCLDEGHLTFEQYLDLNDENKLREWIKNKVNE